MAAPRADRAARREDARPLDLARGNRAPERDRDVPLVAEVAHGREARHQRALGIDDRIVGVVRLAILEVVELARAALFAGQVHVHVHEARQHGRAGQVHDFVAAAGSREAGVDGADVVAVHDDRDALARRVADAVDEAAGVDQRRRGRSRRQERGQGRQAE